MFSAVFSNLVFTCFINWFYPAVLHGILSNLFTDMVITARGLDKS